MTMAELAAIARSGGRQTRPRRRSRRPAATTIIVACRRGQSPVVSRGGAPACRRSSRDIGYRRPSSHARRRASLAYAQCDYVCVWVGSSTGPHSQLKIRRSLVARGRHIELPADLERDRHDITRLGGGQAGHVHLHLSADSVAQAQQCHALTAIGQDFVKDGRKYSVIPSR